MTAQVLRGPREPPREGAMKVLLNGNTYGPGQLLAEQAIHRDTRSGPYTTVANKSCATELKIYSIRGKLCLLLEI